MDGRQINVRSSGPGRLTGTYSCSAFPTRSASGFEFDQNSRVLLLRLMPGPEFLGLLGFFNLLTRIPGGHFDDPQGRQFAFKVSDSGVRDVGLGDVQILEAGQSLQVTP